VTESYSRSRDFRLAVITVLIVTSTGLATWFAVASPTRSISVWGLGQLVVLVVAAAYAAAQLREAQTLRKEQSRPFVVVDVDPWRKKGVFLLTVENIGRTVARDVSLAFDPPLQSTLDDPQRIEREDWPRVADFRIFKEPIPNIPPGKWLACQLDAGRQFFESDLPRRYVATVRYVGPVDHYCEEYVLDLAMYRELPLTIGNA
jgi:hypothetical protein